VLGPPDSGTNLLGSLLKLNFPKMTIRAADKLVFKHSIPQQGADKFVQNLLNALGNAKGNALGNAHVIVMTRSPVSQLGSWLKAPYLFSECVDKFVNNSMSDQHCQPDLHRVGREDLDLGSAGDLPAQFDSVSDIYNQYMHFYEELGSQDFGLSSVTLVAYEDLVLSVEGAMSAIADRTGWKIDGQVKADLESAKSHGDSNGWKEAVEKIQHRTYLASIDEDQRARFCAGLDTGPWREWQESRHENPFVQSRIPYWSDCS